MGLRTAGFLVFSFVLILAVVQCASADVFPTVTFSFDQNTFTYTYTVTNPANSTYPFGYFQVDMLQPYTAVTSKSSSDGWDSGYRRWSVDQLYHFAWWSAPPDGEVPAQTAWTGEFTLVVPNTRPVPGLVLTKDGVGGEQLLQLQVPGPVPEPSGIAVLGIALTSLWKLRPRKR